MEKDPTGCECSECARKSVMLQGLAFAASMGQPLPIIAELQEDLARHKRRAALGREKDRLADRSALLVPSPQRPWLAYDPDALLPSPFDVFLLSGCCPPVNWSTDNLEPADSAAMAQPQLGNASQDLSICYIVGCGRSGSTVFGEILSHYSNVVFLNEPRQLWIPVAPAFDVWSCAAPEKHGRLVFSTEDALQTVNVPPGNHAKPLANVVCDAYCDIANLAPRTPSTPSGRRWIVEKFPEHAFRLPFLHAVCSEGLGPSRCKFLHLVRDGIEVARSISRFENSAAWYGVRDDWKWRQLSICCQEPEFGFGDGFLKILNSTGANNLFARGLAEWTLSILAARRGSDALALLDAASGGSAAGHCVKEVRYEELLAQPADVLKEVENLLGFDCSQDVRRTATETLRTLPEPRPFSLAEQKVLRTLRGSQTDILLREWGHTLPE